MTLADSSAGMRGIDNRTRSTRTEGGAIAGRPMNDDVRSVQDIAADPVIGPAYQGRSGPVPMEVAASRMHHRDGEDEGEVRVR